MLADAVLIGGGIIGLSLGLELAMRGVKATVLERGTPGGEASSAAAGMLAPQLEAEHPGPLLELGLASRDLYPAWIEALEAATGVATGFTISGGITLLTAEEAIARAWDVGRWQDERGLRRERLDREGLRRLIPGVSDAFAGGIHVPDEAQVEPRQLVRALRLACARAGVSVQSGASVGRVIAEGGRFAAVEVGSERVSAGAAVVCAGAWSSLIEGGGVPRGAVQPARGQLIALDAGEPPCVPFVWTGGGYVVPRRDGRVIVGTTLEMAGFEKAVTAEGVRKLTGAAIDTIPSLASARMIESWSGFRPWTSDSAPILGATSTEGLYAATGHHRNGILLAPVTASVMSDVMMGRPPVVDLTGLAPWRFA